jgi:transcription factor IIIB subunit 2
MASTCWSCGEGPVVSDPDSGALVCTSCGRVHDAGAGEFAHNQTFTIDGQLDLSSSKQVYSSENPYLDRKLYLATDVITSTVAPFSLSPTLLHKVLEMAQSATDGALASPGTAFLPALAAACAFLVARSHSLPISLAEAAAAASCTTFALADLASRIASRLSLPPLPSFDYSAALERAVEYSGKLREAAGEKTEDILSQARFLLRCASKWSLTTGRHPQPVVAGVIAFAAELNGVTSMSVEEIALEIPAVPYTSRLRYKELVAALVGVAQKLLPWGADVNARNLLLNAPLLLRLMEMRSQSDPSEQFLESFAPDIASIVQVYSSVDEDESKYLQSVPLDADDLDFKNSGQESEDLKISEGRMSDTYQNVLKRIAQLKELGKVGKVATRRKRWKRGLDLEPWMDSLGNGWTKNMPLEEVPDIDIGYDAPPPSFTAGLELQKRRRARIEAAKCRIDEIRNPPAARTSSTIDLPSTLRIEDACPPQKNTTGLPSALRNEDACPPQKNIKKRRKRQDPAMDHVIHRNHLAEISNAPDCGRKRRKGGACNGIDWEDCVIELLLLHGANEAEIEQGHYKRLLDLHVFTS